ncbi:hypothetical protein Ciccas_003675 [Cichlidogyrus casuarinus]|uniref:Uncharacterized protein n=1 Tax=Cichlidogyrus casuarinus TaxID=1844966 RepID=A0ABD2QFY0_9PLAT
MQYHLLIAILYVFVSKGVSNSPLRDEPSALSNYEWLTKKIETPDDIVVYDGSHEENDPFATVENDYKESLEAGLSVSIDKWHFYKKFQKESLKQAIQAAINDLENSIQLGLEQIHAAQVAILDYQDYPEQLEFTNDEIKQAYEIISMAKLHLNKQKEFLAQLDEASSEKAVEEIGNEAKEEANKANAISEEASEKTEEAIKNEHEANEVKVHDESEEIADLEKKVEEIASGSTIESPAAVEEMKQDLEGIKEGHKACAEKEKESEIAQEDEVKIDTEQTEENKKTEEAKTEVKPELEPKPETISTVCLCVSLQKEITHLLKSVADESLLQPAQQVSAQQLASTLQTLSAGAE